MEADSYTDATIAKEGLETERAIIDYLRTHHDTVEWLGCIGDLEYFDASIPEYKKLQQEGYGDGRIISCSGIYNIEIKRDNYVSKTGNLLAEWSCMYRGCYTGPGWFHYLKPEVRFLLMVNPETGWLYTIDFNKFKYKFIDCMAENKAVPRVIQKVKGKQMLNYLAREELLAGSFRRQKL